MRLEKGMLWGAWLKHRQNVKIPFQGSARSEASYAESVRLKGSGRSAKSRADGLDKCLDELPINRAQLHSGPLSAGTAATYHCELCPRKCVVAHRRVPTWRRRTTQTRPSVGDGLRLVVWDGSTGRITPAPAIRVPALNNSRWRHE